MEPQEASWAMIRNIDPIGKASAPEPNNDRRRDGQRAAVRQDPAQRADAGVVHFSGQALTRRPGRLKSPPPDTWAGAMIDLVLDAAAHVGEAIRKDPQRAALAQAQQSTGDRVLELTVG